MFRDRLVQAKKLLLPDATIWVHLDDGEAHRARCIMDEVFGIDNFLAVITWEKMTAPKMDSRYFSSSHDHIIVYRNSPSSKLNQLPAPPSRKKWLVDEEGREYTWGLLRMDGSRKTSFREYSPTLYFGVEDPDGNLVYPMRPDGKDGAWRWSKEKVERDYHLLSWRKNQQGEWEPLRPKYRKKTRPPTTIWLASEVGNTATAAKESNALFDQSAFSTPKPETLLERIIEIGSNKGDIVLDYFAGSGTTPAVAHKMGRKWVAIERSPDVFRNYTFRRMTKVIKGNDPGGITPKQSWNGGGSFRILEVGPSMFEEGNGGIIRLAPLPDSDLGPSIAAHLEFEYYPEEPPFIGARNQTRLAFIDGMVSPDVVEELLSLLDENQNLNLAVTTIDPQAENYLFYKSPGSKVIRIPGDILKDYINQHRHHRRQDLSIDQALQEGPGEQGQQGHLRV